MTEVIYEFPTISEGNYHDVANRKKQFNRVDFGSRTYFMSTEQYTAAICGEGLTEVFESVRNFKSSAPELRGQETFHVKKVEDRKILQDLEGRIKAGFR
ncbi:hypothetical protein J4462_00065 [Candidatus Pacearchaeota archaeon]|nr:hypothetical protein [Candidatus Pacearchaeota archaeon]